MASSQKISVSRTLPLSVDDQSSSEMGFFKSLCDSESIMYFAKNVWSTAILSWSLYFIANTSTMVGLPFELVTIFTLYLTFVTRTGFVTCPNLAATSGVFGLFTVVTFWSIVALQGRVAAFGDTSYMLFTDLTTHLAIPLDAFARAVLLGYYSSYLAIWYTLFFALSYIVFLLAAPVLPYLFWLTWTDASRYGFYVGMTAAITLLHAIIVFATRRIANGTSNKQRTESRTPQISGRSGARSSDVVSFTRYGRQGLR
jgi:hypothetical protein